MIVSSYMNIRIYYNIDRYLLFPQFKQYMFNSNIYHDSENNTVEHTEALKDLGKN